MGVLVLPDGRIQLSHTVPAVQVNSVVGRFITLPCLASRFRIKAVPWHPASGVVVIVPETNSIIVPWKVLDIA